jgi:peptidoglycan/LPS O-acetylase OafA/YrhL
MTSPPSTGRRRELDGLRLFAILGVLLDHLWGFPKAPWIFGGTNVGVWGVRLFFILSGFLITSILLRGEGLPRAGFAGRFYARRALRIFPAYFGVLGAVLLFELPQRQHLAWLASFSANFYVFLHGHWLGSLSPYWSLAVQEQFYLVWPLLLLFVPRRWVLRILVVLLIAAPLFRLYESYHYGATASGSLAFSQTFPLGVADGLAIGALLALLAHAGVRRSRVVAPAAPAAVLFVALLALSHYGIAVHEKVAFLDTAGLVVLGALVYSCYGGVAGLPGRVLRSRPIVQLGRVSYGIFLYHELVGYSVRWIQRHTHHDVIGFRGPLFFLVCACLTMLVALGSWRFVEGPINGLKRYFPYDGRTPASRARTAPVKPRSVRVLGWISALAR